MKGGTQGSNRWSRGAAPLRPETPRQQATAESVGNAGTSPCPTTADIGVDGDACRRRADRACVTGGGGEVGGDEEDENGELRDVDGGAAARDEAGAATVRSLGDMVSADIPFPSRPPPPARSSGSSDPGIVGTRRTSRAPGGPVTHGGRFVAVRGVVRRPAS